MRPTSTNEKIHHTRSTKLTGETKYYKLVEGRKQNFRTGTLQNLSKSQNRKYIYATN